jgi:hypothetical protein
MARQYPPKNINYNPNLITGDLLVDGSLVVEGNIVAVHNLSMHGNIIFQPDQYMVGNVFTPYASKTTITPNTDYSVGIQDRIILISTTEAGVNTITLGDFQEFIFEITIIMTAHDTGDYNVVTTLIGDILFNATGLSNTFIHIGNGIWSLSKT